MRRLFYIVLIVFVLVVWVPFGAGATQVIRVNLPHIVDNAGIAFAGTCIDRQVEVKTGKRFPDGLVVTTYVFRVERWLKGEGEPGEAVGRTIRFSQWGATRKEAKELGVPFLIGQPHYEVGKGYVLFLTPKSASTGLTSPIGLGQGAFDILIKPDGSKFVQNRFFNASLFVGVLAKPRLIKALSAGKVEAGEVKPEIPLNDFYKMVGELAD